MKKGSGSATEDGLFAPDMRKVKARKLAKTSPVVEAIEPERRKRKVRKVAGGNGQAEKAEVGDANTTEDMVAQGVFYPKKKKKAAPVDPAEIAQPDLQVAPSLEPQPVIQAQGPPRIDMFPQQPGPVTDEGTLVLYHLDAKDLGTINILTNFLVDMGYIRATDPGLMFKFAIEYLRVGVMTEINASLEQAEQQTT